MKPALKIGLRLWLAFLFLFGAIMLRDSSSINSSGAWFDIVFRVILWLITVVAFILLMRAIEHRKELMELYKQSASVSEMFEAMELKLPFMHRKASLFEKGGKMKNYVVADAQVIDSKKSVHDYIDEKGRPQRTVSYILTVKYYTGTQSATAIIESEFYDKTIKICYNADDPKDVRAAEENISGKRREKSEKKRRIYDMLIGISDAILFVSMLCCYLAYYR